MIRASAAVLFLLCLPAVPQELNTAPRPQGETVSVKRDFGARGDDEHDDTAAIQKCIDFAATNRASCFLPPGIYKHTGLHIFSGFPSLYGLQSEGNGTPILKYYGTGTCLAIGDGKKRLWGINLANFSCAVANGYSAANGIYVRNTSGGYWNGITAQGLGTGVFANHFHFSDADLLWMEHINVNDQKWTAGTVGFLLDDRVKYGNSSIHLDGGDQSDVDKMYVIRQCASCKFSKYYIENASHAFYIDNTSHPAEMDNIVLDNGTVNTSGTGPSVHRILTVIGAAGKLLQVDQIRFTNNRFFLSGGVTSPIAVSIDPSPAANSYVNLFIDNNAFTGANTSLVVSNSILANVYFGPNFAMDASGKKRTPNVTGLATVSDAAVKHSTVSAALNFSAPPAVPGCTPAVGLTNAGAAAGSAPVTYSPPVSVPVGMIYSAWTEPNGQVVARWCQFSGQPTDPDGSMGAVYAVSVIQ